MLEDYKAGEGALESLVLSNHQLGFGVGLYVEARTASLYKGDDGSLCSLLWWVVSRHVRQTTGEPGLFVSFIPSPLSGWRGSFRVLGDHMLFLIVCFSFIQGIVNI